MQSSDPLPLEARLGALGASLTAGIGKRIRRAIRPITAQPDLRPVHRDPESPSARPRKQPHRSRPASVRSRRETRRGGIQERALDSPTGMGDEAARSEGPTPR